MEIEDLSFPSEEAMQSAIFSFFWNNFPQTRRLIFHCPNGGTRNKLEAIKFRSIGVVKGIPDLLCLGVNNFFAIELKMPKGVISDEQKYIHHFWISNGYPVYVAYSYKQACEIIMKEFNLTDNCLFKNNSSKMLEMLEN